nr:MAG TPA: hypothetical protein [Caudoviricetes sp.]
MIFQFLINYNVVFLEHIAIFKAPKIRGFFFN